MVRSFFNKRSYTLLALLLVGSLVTLTAAIQDVSIGSLDASGSGLSLDEQAYYEYVAPRLDVLVTEVDATVEMVETKSRDIIALTRAGNTIDTLTAEIREYGETHGVPPRFADVHTRLMDATETVTATFDQARQSLQTFNFRGMRDLVASFTTAADDFSACQQQLHALADG